MKLKIRNQEEEEDILELYLHKDPSGNVDLMSMINGDSRYELTIYTNKQWTKFKDGHLNDTQEN